ncbi:MAG TPA: TIGR01841 family phasin [Stellaceae bacterium]|nr:TIGR01841 family phasin [Stellaceae bacterium]
MAKTTTDKNGILDLTKVPGNFGIPGADVGVVVEAQRRNFAALAEANQLAAESMQVLAQRQTEIVQEAVQDTWVLIRDWTQPAAHEDRLVKQAEAAKQAFEKAFANARELNELSIKAGTNVFDVFARRVGESLDEMRLYAKKQVAAE